MSYPRNNASPERIAVGAVVQISDGAVQTSGVSISVRGQGGASGAGAGTTAYDNGIVQYTPTQGETDFTSFVIVAYKTGCIPASVTVVTSASGTPGVVVVPSTQKVDVETIKTQSVTCAAGVTVPSSIASPTNITSGTITTVSGNVTGSVGSMADNGASLTDIPDMLVTDSGTASAGGASTITLATSASTNTNHYKDQVIVLTGGTGVGQTNRIVSYDSFRVATVETPWVEVPDGFTTYKVLGRAS